LADEISSNSILDVDCGNGELLLVLNQGKRCPLIGADIAERVLSWNRPAFLSILCRQGVDLCNLSGFATVTGRQRPQGCMFVSLKKNFTLLADAA